MDLIYMNSEKEDIGVLKDYKFDLAFGTDENDFECTVNITNHVCQAGYYLYYEGTEYGGIIDSIKVNTDADEITYIGRTWHGMLESHILQPDENQDYLVVSGEANSVLASLIARMGVGSLFKASLEESGINISDYKMNRYVGAYEGIRKMLKASGGKLNLSFKDGFVELSAKPLVDYSQDEQFDTDQIDFDIQKNYKPLNHVICLGKGDLKDRRVIHVYADASGNISGTQTFAGLDEVCAVYDNSNVESDDELKQGGIDMIQDSWASMSVDFSFETDNESIDVGDVIGAKERITGIVVVAMISKKIVSISNNATSISYECEGNSGMVSSGSYPASGSGNVIVIDTELSTTSENPVQNKVVTKALNNKSNSDHTHIFLENVLGSATYRLQLESNETFSFWKNEGSNWSCLNNIPAYIGKLYKVENNKQGTGNWDISDVLTLPAGIYIVIYKAVDKNASGTEMLCGMSYNVGGYAASGSSGLANYIDILTLTSESPIRAFFYANPSAYVNVTVRALRIG